MGGKKRKKPLETNGFSRKKVLSLVLCVAVMLSVMVLGAGAAFSDQGDIENTEAVNMCSALNIIGGYEDGSFHPERNIKRSEITKMICVALNGGKEPNVSTNAVPTFSDVRGTSAAWAEGYIESCVAQGIVSGVGGGRFAPDGNVTAAQLAKMLLVALGYNSDNEGFTGNAWETNVNVRAAQKGLYAGLETMDTSVAVTRDQAAQMVWNALNAYEVEYKTNLVTDANGNLVTQITVQDKQVIGSNDTLSRVTLMEDKYEAETFVGTFTGNYDTDAAGKEGYIAVEKDGKSATFPYNFDLSYIGEEVKVIYKDNKTEGTGEAPDAKDTIYGVVVTGGTSVVNATAADIDDDYNTAGKVAINDEAYKVATTGNIFKNYVNAATSSWKDNAAAGVAAIEGLSATNGDTVKFVLNDQNEIISVYVTNYAITKVTAVNSTKVSLNGIGAITIEDNNIYSGIAKNDVVVYTKLYNNNSSDATFVVTKAETVSGTLDGYKTTEKVTIDGTTYSTMNKQLTGGLTDDAKTSFTTSDIGEAITAYMVNGYIACVDMTASSSNYAVVEDVSKAGTIGGVDEFKMKVMLADGSEKTVTIDSDSTDSNGDKWVSTELQNLVAGTIVKYASISESNVMDLTAIKCGEDTTASYNEDTKEFGGTITTSDAVLFVYASNTGKYYAYNIRSLGDITTGSNAKKVLDKDGKVEAAYIQLTDKPSSASADTIYGIVTAANGTVKVGDEYKNSYSVANDQGSYTVYMPSSSSKLIKGAIVSFDKASDDIYVDNDMTVYTSADAKYIKELDKDNVLSYYDTIGGAVVTKALDNDAQTVYVDQDNDAAGENIGVNEYDTITKYANAVIVLDSNKEKIVAIIVESSGECNVIDTVGALAATTKDQPASAEALDNSMKNDADYTTWEGVPYLVSMGLNQSIGTDSKGNTCVFLTGTVTGINSSTTLTENMKKGLDSYWGQSDGTIQSFGDMLNSEISGTNIEENDTIAFLVVTEGGTNHFMTIEKTEAGGALFMTGRGIGTTQKSYTSADGSTYYVDISGLTFAE